MPTVCPIDIWTFALVADDAQLNKFKSIISAEEQQRALRLRAADHQRRALISAAMLRSILSQYLHIKPEAIVYSYNEFRKPFIANHPVHFNISHSQDQAIVAINTEFEIGVDIERLRDKIDIQGLVRKVYTPNEQAQFAQLHPEAQIASFYKVWTCKEAILKALGTGLHHPLSQIEVEVDSKKSSKIKEIDSPLNSSHKFVLQEVDTAEDFIAHVAIVVPKNACKNFEFRYYPTPPL